MARKAAEPIEEGQTFEATEPISSTKEKDVYTNWAAFEQAGLNPKEIVCEGYWPYHLVNNGCHTPLVPTAENMQAHLEKDHGGGFAMKLVQSERKLWDGWKNLKALGLELNDLRCGVCGQELKVTAQTLLKHLRPHINQNRRMQDGGKFYLTIGYGRPDFEEE